MSDNYITIRGIKCPIVMQKVQVSKPDEPDISYRDERSVDFRGLGVLQNSMPSAVYEHPNIKRFLIQHNNVVEFLNKNYQTLPSGVTIEIYKPHKYSTKICQVEIDEHKMITLDIHYEALKKSNLSFEHQNKLFQLILRGEGNLQLNTTGTFESLEEVVILMYGAPGDRTLPVWHRGYHKRANIIKGFTTEWKRSEFNPNAQRHLPTCNLDWLYNAPNIKNIFISHESNVVLTKPTSAVSYPEQLCVVHCKVDSNFLSQLQMSNMKKIVLDHCGLTVFPQEINQAKQLEVLSLLGNDFNDQSIDLASLTELEVLDLRQCKINTCPQRLHKLQKLKDINLGFNNLNNCLETMEVIPNIITFKAYNSGITVFPKALGKMNSLQTLNLMGSNFEQYGKANNKDETNLDQIGDLTELTHLDLSFCHLNTIPQKIFQLPKLQELEIEHNQLTELPKTVVDMLKRDTEIWASGNHLERPPQDMCEDYDGEDYDDEDYDDDEYHGFFPLDKEKILKIF